jgi:uncharacterized protein YndB with AHSA1/START domain
MSEPETVAVSVSLAAPPEIVFPFFTDQARYVEWMGEEAVLEATPGGLYHVQMGDGFGVDGTFLELDPPTRVVFTWGWALNAGKQVRSGPQDDATLLPGSTRVVVTLAKEGSGTFLSLQHHDLATKLLRDNHQIAWRTYLGRLVVRVAGGHPGPEPHG